jgi:osmotically-inducible protein OsmY
VLLSFVAASWPGEVEAFTPYRLLVQAAKSPESASVFVQDKRLRSQLHRALIVAVPEATLSISPYVWGSHAYLVGWVDDEAERSKLEEAARGVSGLVSVQVYLPVKPKGEAAPSSTDELKLKAAVIESLMTAIGTDKTNVSVDVLGAHAVLVGVLGSADEVHAATEAAQNTQGVQSVSSFLGVPPSEDRKLLGRRLR